MIILSKRLKLLVAVAAAIGIYVFASAPDQTTAPGDAARGDGGPGRRMPSAVRGAQSTLSRGAVGAVGAEPLARLTVRVTNDKAAGSLFPVQSWYVAPPPPPPLPVVQVKPPPPTAPPLPFAVMGRYSRPGDASVYFLTRGDRVFDVHIGDTLDGIYTVDSETNGQLLLTYKPLQIQQALPLEGAL